MIRFAALVLGVLAAGLVTASSASAALFHLDVRASVENATDARITVLYKDGDGRLQRRTLAPGARLSNVTADDDELALSLPDCGSQRLTLRNPPTSTPGANLRNPFYDQNYQHRIEVARRGSGRSLDERETAHLDNGGVRLDVTRREDSRNYKEFDAVVRSCRAAPEAADAPSPAPAAPETRSSSRAARATVRNSTDRPQDIAYYDADSRWRTRTVGPGQAIGDVTFNGADLLVLFEDCGASELLVGWSWAGPIVKLGTLETNTPYQTLDDVDRPASFERVGTRVVVTRQDDSAAYRELTVDLQRCDAP